MSRVPFIRLLSFLRVAFVLMAAWFIWWRLHGERHEIVGAVLDRSTVAVVGAFLLILLALLLTGILWMQLLRSFGYALAWHEGFRIFFVGQLGKYIPGSVWSFGAQADGARRSGVPVRVTLAASSLFLGLNLVTAVFLGLLLAAITPFRAHLPAWAQACLLVLSVGLLLPPVLNRLFRVLSGRVPDLALGGRSMVAFLATAVGAWTCYAIAVLLLSPERSVAYLASLSGAFMLAYAAGVVVVFAPAGLGAREATFVLLTTPTLGVADAVSLALIARLLMTIADVVLAVWFAMPWGRRARSAIPKSGA